MKMALRIAAAMVGILGATIASSQVQPNPPTNVVIDDGLGDAMFSDDFEYVVGRTDTGLRETFTAHGWSAVKSGATHPEGAHGNLYTVDRIPGYTGIFPGRNSRRVLAIEALPTTMGGQTDFYLQLGGDRAPDNAIPANVWFQFWLYPNYYDDPNNQNDQLSRFSIRNKLLYPCIIGSYPCPNETGQRWHFLSGSAGCNGEHEVVQPGDICLTTWETDLVTIASSRPEDAWKMYQNSSNAPISRNRWTLVKLHFDTSGPTGTYEAWLRPMGGSWTKIAEWIGGVTPGLTWNIPTDLRGGHRVLRMPTTINAPPDGLDYDSWTYMDDFVMATSEAALPVYD